MQHAERRTWMAVDDAREAAASEVTAATLQRPSRSARRIAARFNLQPIEAWNESADVVWTAFAPSISVGVERSNRVLPFLYPRAAAGPQAWACCRDG
ncbi:MAG TPA: hypothetical protein VL173_07775, partial [Vicinamibacterales bacterium]|nr:hypothetical protein [Vicinamibacterales bacterium]